MTIPTLIDKQDTFEIVRDQIATILVTEIVSQQALAVADSKDPDLWKVRIYTERSNAWEQFLEVPPADESPICNVWYDQDSFPENRGNTVSRQTAQGIFNLDCFGYGISTNDPAGGHEPGDKEAAFEAHRALRIVRNIIMAAEYVNLGLRPNVGNRWPQSRNSFQREFQELAIQQVAGARLALRVDYNEFSPQVAAETLEYISTTIRRAEDGEIVAVVDVDHS
jgi:hypothetical protein